MAVDLSHLSNSVDKIVTEVPKVHAVLDAVRSELADIKAGQITQEQIDSMTSKLDDAEASMEAMAPDAPPTQ